VRRRIIDRTVTVFAAIAAALTVAAFATVLGLVIGRGARAISWSFLTTATAEAGGAGGVVYQILGTLLLIATATAISVPLAAGAGIWLHMYASERMRAVLAPALHATNGVPSIVFGLLGFAFFFRLLGMKKSWLAGGILLAIMILPTLVVAFLERLRSIPHESVLAAFGHGLGRGDVVRCVLLPQAVSGLFTGTLLGIARAAGETAPIMFTAAVFDGARLPHGIADSPVVALPYHIFVLAQDSLGDGVATRLWGTAAVLVLMVMFFSAAAIPLRLRIPESERHD
jgi:phosphate transport system permease protein